ncbi:MULTISPECIES: hypothetical protein [Providencia]|uniref:Uncharacterized protein n=1 Tax=Providencia huaxiensis TaxID=2027290 RepID=A0A8I2ALH0_9GAMM|nr:MULTISPECIES: hypothetical protein [Providencia]MBQ0268409.1 hypothetical protein [Providencia huaxiensis]
MWLINGALRDKRIYILLIMAFLGGMNNSRADYNPVETLRNIDGYFYEKKYGSSIFGRVITDYFYLVMKEKKKIINNALIEKINYDHALEMLQVLKRKERKQRTGEKVSHDMTYKEADELHYLVMLRNKIPEEAWVLGVAFSVLDKKEKEHYWQKIMAASGDRGHELSVIYSLMKVILEKEKKATKKQKIIINKWYERMSKILASAKS